MLFAAAKRFDELDRYEEARQRYLAVTAIDPQGLGPQAEFHVAEIAARVGRGEECVRRCRGLVGKLGIEQNPLLAVMGHGYELLGKHRLAAECFAGHVPAE
jgi:hypothetical protein